MSTVLQNRGRVLIIAGSDSGGGAGIQADIKAVTALGGYAATAITALTVQDTITVHDVFDVPAKVVAEQIRVVSQGSDTRYEGRVISVTDGLVLTEALTPEEDRGNVVELRPEPTQLVIQDRRSEVRLVMAKCP